MEGQAEGARERGEGAVLQGPVPANRRAGLARGRHKQELLLLVTEMQLVVGSSCSMG